MSADSQHRVSANHPHATAIMLLGRTLYEAQNRVAMLKSVGQDSEAGERHVRRLRRSVEVLASDIGEGDD